MRSSDLDNYITGHYGEDQFRDETEPVHSVECSRGELYVLQHATPPYFRVWLENQTEDSPRYVAGARTLSEAKSEIDAYLDGIQNP